MRIEVISVADKIEQVMSLLEEHYEEVAQNKGVMKLKPDVQQYAALEAAGMLIGIAAYDDELMVGYSVTIILPHHLHYYDLCYATNDVLFVSKAYRSTSVGLKLMSKTRQLARERGAKLLCWHAKEGSKLAAILPKQGCKVQDIIFSEEL